MKKKSLFVLSMAAFLLSSISASWIAIIDRKQYLAISSSLAVAFWITLLSGIAFCVMLAQKTKPKEKAVQRLLNFFKGRALAIIDGVLVFSVICTVLISVCQINSALLWSTLLFLNVFSIELHCLFCIKNREG